MKARFNKDGDFQIWEIQTLEKSINSKLGIRIDNEYRFGDDASNIFFLYVQGFLVYRPFNWIIISPGYRQEWLREDGSLRPRYSPQIDTYFIYINKKIVVTNRNRAAYLIKNNNPNLWIYRSRLRFIFPLEINSFPIQPFVDDEIFIVESRGFDQNRFSVGLLFPFHEHFESRFFYMLRLRKDNNWRQMHIFGLHFYFVF